MSTEPSKLLTASEIAKNLGVSDAKVKQTIRELEIPPAVKKGCRVYFSDERQKQIASALSR